MLVFGCDKGNNNSRAGIDISLIQALVENDYFYESREDFFSRISSGVLDHSDLSYNELDSLYKQDRNRFDSVSLVLSENLLKINNADLFFLVSRYDTAASFERKEYYTERPDIEVLSKQLGEKYNVSYSSTDTRLSNLQSSLPAYLLKLGEILITEGGAKAFLPFEFICGSDCCRKGIAFLRCEDGVWFLEDINVRTMC